MNKILIIGCGHMGSALLKAWSQRTNYLFYVIDPKQHKKINNTFKRNVTAFSNLNQLSNLSSIDLVIFATKPQIIEDILKDINNYKFKKKTIFVSIIAGKKISFFKKFLPNYNQIIRVMPNMPAMINQGMSCLIFNKSVLKKNINLVNRLFLKVGKTLILKREQDINKVTAISGSGPGYIFLLIDAFEKAAIELGLGQNKTKKLVHQTFLGSIKLFLNTNQEALILANNVAVKGGTTEAGVNIFKDRQILHKTFKKVIKTAYNKANEIGK